MTTNKVQRWFKSALRKSHKSQTIIDTNARPRLISPEHGPLEPIYPDYLAHLEGPKPRQHHVKRKPRQCDLESMVICELPQLECKNENAISRRQRPPRQRSLGAEAQTSGFIHSKRHILPLPYPLSGEPELARIPNMPSPLEYMMVDERPPPRYRGGFIRRNTQVLRNQQKQQQQPQQPPQQQLMSWGPRNNNNYMIKIDRAIAKLAVVLFTLLMMVVAGVIYHRPIWGLIIIM